MKWHRKLMIGVGVFSAGVVWASSDADRYRVILDRRPFGSGELPMPSNVSQEVRPAGPSINDSYRLSAILESEMGAERSYMVGLVEVRSGKSFYLALGEDRDGLELLKADPENQEALVRRGHESAVLRLPSSAAPAATDAGSGRRPAVAGTPNPRAEEAAARRRARYAQPPVEPSTIQREE